MSMDQVIADLMSLEEVVHNNAHARGLIKKVVDELQQMALAPKVEAPIEAEPPIEFPVKAEPEEQHKHKTTRKR